MEGREDPVSSQERAQARLREEEHCEDLHRQGGVCQYRPLPVRHWHSPATGVDGHVSLWHVHDCIHACVFRTGFAVRILVCPSAWTVATVMETSRPQSTADSSSSESKKFLMMIMYTCCLSFSLHSLHVAVGLYLPACCMY